MRAEYESEVTVGVYTVKRRAAVEEETHLRDALEKFRQEASDARDFVTQADTDMDEELTERAKDAPHD